MSCGELCGQKDCREYARWRYTWPGKDEAYICDKHVRKLRSVVECVGMHLQIIPFQQALVGQTDKELCDLSFDVQEEFERRARRRT